MKVCRTVKKECDCTLTNFGFMVMLCVHVCVAVGHCSVTEVLSQQPYALHQQVKLVAHSTT